MIDICVLVLRLGRLTGVVLLVLCVLWEWHGPRVRGNGRDRGGDDGDAHPEPLESISTRLRQDEPEDVISMDVPYLLVESLKPPQLPPQASSLLPHAEIVILHPPLGYKHVVVA